MGQNKDRNKFVEALVKGVAVGISVLTMSTSGCKNYDPSIEIPLGEPKKEQHNELNGYELKNYNELWENFKKDWKLNPFIDNTMTEYLKRYVKEHKLNVTDFDYLKDKFFRKEIDKNQVKDFICYIEQCEDLDEETKSKFISYAYAKIALDNLSDKSSEETSYEYRRAEAMKKAIAAADINKRGFSR